MRPDEPHTPTVPVGERPPARTDPGLVQGRPRPLRSSRLRRRHGRTVQRSGSVPLRRIPAVPHRRAKAHGRATGPTQRRRSRGSPAQNLFAARGCPGDLRRPRPDGARARVGRVRPRHRCHCMEAGQQGDRVRPSVAGPHRRSNRCRGIRRRSRSPRYRGPTRPNDRPSDVPAVPGRRLGSRRHTPEANRQVEYDRLEAKYRSRHPSTNGTANKIRGRRQTRSTPALEHSGR